MNMQQMMDFVQRFKNMDTSKVTVDQSKDFAIQEAIQAGANENQIGVIVQNVFGEQP